MCVCLCVYLCVFVRVHVRERKREREREYGVGQPDRISFNVVYVHTKILVNCHLGNKKNVPGARCFVNEDATRITYIKR